MTTETSIQPDRAKRECDCPEQVETCRHFDGQRLVFAAMRSLSPVHRAAHFWWHFSVIVGDDVPPVSCPCGCGALIGAASSFTTSYAGDSEADALDAFYKAERELLHGPDQEDASRTLTRETSQRSSGYEADA